MPPAILYAVYYSEIFVDCFLKIYTISVMSIT
jgi:hypothetical protein